MRKKLFLLATMLSWLWTGLYSQALTGYNFRVVNMIPNSQSDETNFDSETNIAVNPANTTRIVGSAFTRNPSGTSSAPVFVSTNGGTTWSLNNILPSGNGMTGDISIGYGGTSGFFYAGILRGGSSFRSMVLRTSNASSAATMTTLSDRSTELVDQPYLSATTANDASATPRDRVFAGDNRFGGRLSNGGNGKTAEVTVTNDGAATPLPTLATRVMEERTTFEEDFPAIRMAIHNSGVVYGIYYRWASGGAPSERCDVVVARDDNFATGATQFKALTDAGDSKAGKRVVTNVLVPAFGVSLGNNRLVGSNLAIAVDPNNSANVFIAWCDRVGASDYTIHLRRSTNSGAAWSSDVLTVTNATNPAIAVANNGKVAFLYQQLTGTGSTSRWETHFRTSSLFGTTFTDDVLSTFLNSDLAASPISPSLGDYLEMQSVGNSFFGVFPASNRPVNSNFPHSVTYQRNANFTTNQLRNTANNANISVSVDPFFFKISPSLVNICVLHPEICNIVFFDKSRFRLPPNPCLSCPFVLPLEKLVEALNVQQPANTILDVPYYHLLLQGYNPAQYELKIVTADGEAIDQEINRTEKGFVISFRPLKNQLTAKKGLRGLNLMALPKTEEAAKKGLDIIYGFSVSDYGFKEFMRRQ